MSNYSYLKNRRSELGLTMKQVAERVGVSEGTVSRWESGDIANMRRDKIAKLAEALQTTTTKIMGWPDDPNEEAGSLSAVLAPREQDLLKFYRGVGPSAQDYLYNKAKLLYTDALIERDAPTIGGIAAYGGDSDAIIQTKDQQKKAEEFWRKQNEKNRKD